MAIFYKITHEEANFDLIPQGADYDALMPILKKASPRTSTRATRRPSSSRSTCASG